MEKESMRDDRAWQVRAAAWELMALSLRYPEAQLADAVSSDEWRAAAREIASALELDLPASWDDGILACVGRGPEALLRELRAEATRLFVGAPEPAVSPYEGVHRAAADGVQALLFVNPHSMDVERFAKACGLGRPQGTNEPLDHVATECELLEHLALRAAGAPAAEGAPAEADLPGGSASAAYDAFLEEHARAWMPGFSCAVAAESREPFYRAAAQLLHQLLQLR